MTEALGIIELLEQDMRNGVIVPLDARLVDHVDHEGIPRIQHPLLCQIFYTPIQHRLYNMGFHQKLRAFKEYLRENEWMSLMNLIERPFRIPAFAKYAPRMVDEHYWSVLAFVYIDSENIDQHAELMRELLTSKRPRRELLMHDAERAALDAMPEVLDIYKGFSASGDWRSDFSFSLSKKVASWFARRYGCEDPMLMTAKVRKKDVIAYFTGRNEEEILVDPFVVLPMQTTALSPAPQLNNIGGGLHQIINRLT